MIYILILSFFFIYICACVDLCSSKHKSWGLEEGVRFPGTEVIGGGHEPPGGWVLETESESSTRAVSAISC